jgi:hypothetical protein
MAGWTSRETALYIRGVVQMMQYSLEGRLGKKLVKDGKYSKETHEAFRAALYGSDRETDRARALTLDAEGPRQDAAFLFPDVSAEDAQWFAVAWAWWAQARVRPIPSGTVPQIAAGNAKLTSEGDMILTPKDAEEFVGDVPPKSTARSMLPYLGIALGVGIAGVLGWKWGQERCPLPGASAGRMSEYPSRMPTARYPTRRGYR